MSEKLCMFCSNFGLDRFEIEAYGTYTGSYLVGGFTCGKGHYPLVHGERPDDIDDFRDMIKRAEKCKDYSPPKSKEE